MVSNRHIDGGWAWFIMIACFGICYSVVSLGKCFGMLIMDLHIKFSSNIWTVTTIQGTSLFLWTALGPISNILSLRFSERKVIVFGGIIGTVGFFGSYLAPNIKVLFFTHGILVGTAYGLTYTPGMVMVTKYFKKKIGLAMGICQTGVGLGTLTIPIFIRYISDHYDVSGCLLLLGTFIIHSCVFGMLMRPLKHSYSSEEILTATIDDELPKSTFKHIDQGKSSQTNDQISDNNVDLYTIQLDNLLQKEDNSSITLSKYYNEKNELNCCSKIGNCKHLSILCNRKFIRYLLGAITSASVYDMSYMMLPNKALSMNISKSDIAYITMIIGGSDMFARICLGFISDFQLIKRKYLFSFSVICAGITALIVPFTETTNAFFASCFLTGLFGAASATLLTLVLVDEIPSNQLPNAYGFIFFFEGVTYLTIAQILGVIFDVTQSWNASFFFIAAFTLIGGMAMAFDQYLLKG